MPGGGIAPFSQWHKTLLALAIAIPALALLWFSVKRAGQPDFDPQSVSVLAPEVEHPGRA
jgi:hypothetical protein